MLPARNASPTQAILGAIIALTGLPTALKAEPPAVDQPGGSSVKVSPGLQRQVLQSAIQRALPPIEKSMATFRQRRKCFSCHHHTLPIATLAEARSHGFPIDQANFQAQVQSTLAEIRRRQKRFRQGKHPGGRVDSAGMSLWALSAGGIPPEAATAAVAEYLLLTNQTQKYWSGTRHRPPSMSSDLTRAALALQGLHWYANEEQQQRANARVEKTRAWLQEVEVQHTEDRVFRLWALAQLEVELVKRKELAAELISHQQADGGWAQQAGMASDAYATGSALVALHQAGGVEVTARAYQRGLAFLLKSQQSDGTWQVRSRSRPIQAYFESGFPYGKDQFISMAASCWATTALLLASGRQEDSGTSQEPQTSPSERSSPDSSSQDSSSQDSSSQDSSSQGSSSQKSLDPAQTRFDSSDSDLSDSQKGTSLAGSSGVAPRLEQTKAATLQASRLIC